jgi:hypothetical protein
LQPFERREVLWSHLLSDLLGARDARGPNRRAKATVDAGILHWSIDKQDQAASKAINECP